jgi:dolichyl-phosphate beta-glucosyltransferase
MLGHNVERQFKRHLLGRIYATLVSESLNIPIYDSQCGLKIIPRAAYESIAHRLTIKGFAFDVDLLVNLIDHGTPVIEVPIDWHEEPGGKVHLLRDSYRMARDIFHIRQNRRP